MGEQTKFMNSIALATINAVRAEVAHVPDTGLPLDVFPAKVQEIILDLAAEDNFPVEYTAVAMLSAVSAAIGNTRHIRLKPSWESNPSLYIILVGEPGQGKTPPLDFAYKPMEDHDYAMYIKFKDEMELYNATADKGKSDVGSGKEKPVLIQTILSDSTPESLWRLHNDNQRGVVLLIDEIMGFFHSVCRYNDNPFMSQLLTAYTGKQVKVTRCNNPIPAIIRKPCINVIGTTQTERIHEFFTDENVNSGLIDRFMFVIPKEVRPTLWSITDKEKPVGIVKAPCNIRWNNILTRLIQLECSYSEDGTELATVVLDMTYDAKCLFYNWRNKLKEEAFVVSRQGNTEANRLVRRTAKMETNVGRLALIFQMLRWACGEATDTLVDEKSIRCALRIHAFMEESYTRILDIVDSHNMEPDKKEFLDLLGNPFTTAEAIAAGAEVGMSASGVKKNLPKLIHQKYISKKAHGLYEKVPSCSLQTLSTLGTIPLSEAHVDTESSQSTPSSIIPKCNDNDQQNQTPTT